MRSRRKFAILDNLGSSDTVIFHVVGCRLTSIDREALVIQN